MLVVQQCSRNAIKEIKDPLINGINKGSRLSLFLCGGSQKKTVAAGANKLFQWALGCSLVVGGRLVVLPVVARCQVIQARPRTEPGLGVVPHDSRFPVWQFLRMLWPHILAMTVAILAALAVAMINTQISLNLGNLVNVVSAHLPGQDQQTLADASADFVANITGPAKQLARLYLAHAGLTCAYIYSLAVVGERLAEQMRMELYEAILRQDVAFFDGHKSGEVVSRLSTDVQEFKSSFKLVVSQGLRCVTQTVGSAMALYTISPRLTNIMMIVVPGVIAAGALLGSLLRRMSKMAQAQVAIANAVAEEAVANIRTVRAFAQEGHELDRYRKEVDRSRALNEWLGLGIGLFQAGTVLFLNGVVLGTLYHGGHLMASHEMSPGDLMAFLVSTQTIQRSLAQMSLLFGQFVRGTTAGTRVFDYINLVPTIPLHGGRKIPYHSFLGNVAFEGVTFHYPTRPNQTVLDDFNLEIPGGKMVALVGPSGGGKSTVAALLERFYDVNGGKVTLDGVDLREVDPKWLRGQAIGYINQEPVLFATTIMENIRYGRPSATDVEVYEAAKAANAHDFIRTFPNGYDTVVGERGLTVSGGQKQRIAIARALLKNPSILVLDEATSALDAQSEQVVQEALDTVCKGRTVLVIAHRLSTIRNADFIAVLSKGAIVEMGTHEQLRQLGGAYYNLISQQEQQPTSVLYSTVYSIP